METSTETAESPERLDSRALQRAAAAADLAIGDRLMETLRTQGLIPRPARSGHRGRAPLWVYPPGTDRQLVTLLHWRQYTKDSDVLRILLWLDGFAIPATDVRAALIRWAETVTCALDRAIRTYAQRHGLDPDSPAARDNALEEFARIAAAKRKPSLVPRHNRVPAADRAHAVALMIRTFGFGEPAEGVTEQQALTVERVLGIAPGRKHRIEGQGPWLTGPASALFEAADIVALPRLLDAARSATDTDIQAARQTVVAVFRFLPLMVRFLDAAVGDSNYIGMAGLQNIDQHPEHVPYLLLVIIAMLRAGWTENLHAITDALGAAPGLADGMQRILELPQQTLQANLSGQPPEIHQRIKRLINAATDGELDLAPRPLTG
jgi:hypothetical protein